MKKKLIACLLAICMIAGLTVGCTSNEDPAPTDANTQQPSSNPATNDPNATDIGSGLVSYMNPDDPEPKYGGDLVLIQGWFTDFYLPAVSGNGAQMLTEPAIESLGRQLPDKTWVPFLAESWEANEEDATFTIKVREGIKFHDGSDLNAEVVAWNIQEIMDAGRGADICYPTSVEATDEYTVVIQYESYQNVWVEQLSMVHIVSKATYDAEGEDYMSTHAVGTGAFIQDEMIQGTSIKYVRNDNYWQEGLPFLDSITLMNITDENTKISSMMNGEVHGVSISKGSSITQLSAADGIKRQEATNAGYTWLAVQARDENSPFSDVRVRQALMYAIDREAVAQAVTEGIGHARCQFANPGQLDYLEDPITYDYDEAKAKELLAEAGYPNGFDTVIEVVQTQEAAAVAIQSYLKSVGINAEISLLDTATHTQIKANGDIKGINVWGGSSQATSMCNFYTRFVGPNRNTYVNSNPTIEELDKLLAEIPTIADPDEWKAECQEMGRIFNEQLPMLPFFSTVSEYFMSDNLYGFEYFGAWQWTPETSYFA